MNIFEQANFECELNLKKIDHKMISLLDTFFIKCEEVELSHIDEYTSSSIIEESAKDLGKKIGELIQSIIDAIRDLSIKVRDKVVEMFTSKDAKDKLDEVKELIEEDPKLGETQVEIIDDEKETELLNDYIREMAKLERTLMAIKAQSIADSEKQKSNGMPINNTYLIMSTNEILHQMDQLNAKYDKQMLERNKDIIKMALKDAIRFNEKQLDRIKVDYDAVERESSKILAEFKKDANGCDVPVKYNIIRSMANHIGTRTRKRVMRKTDFTQRNIKAIFRACK